MTDCLFCKFVSGEIPVDKLYEDADFIVIRDIAPVAKNHFLVIPKDHFKYLSEATDAQAAVVGKILKKIPELSSLLNLENGYRLVINQGDDAGQTVPHLHVHVLSGQKMGWQPA